VREEKKSSVNLQSLALAGWNFTHVKKEKKPKKINNQGGEKLDWISKVSCWHIGASNKIERTNPTSDIRSFALTCYRLENVYYTYIQ
jgi:PIN domain nuclease of toxin-antitoxin system